MKIVNNKALLLRLRNPKKVTEVIPQSQELPDNKVIVRWGIDEAHVLKNLNIKVPSPIEGSINGQANTPLLNIRKQHLLSSLCIKKPSASTSKAQAKLLVRYGLQIIL